LHIKLGQITGNVYFLNQILDGFDQYFGWFCQNGRQNCKISRAIANAKFRYKASIDSIRYDSSRYVYRNKIMRLAECEYIDKAENLLITGISKPHYPINEKLIIWL